MKKGPAEIIGDGIDAAITAVCNVVKRAWEANERYLEKERVELTILGRSIAEKEVTNGRLGIREKFHLWNAGTTEEAYRDRLAELREK